MNALSVFNFRLVLIFIGAHWFWSGTHDFLQEELFEGLLSA